MALQNRPSKSRKLACRLAIACKFGMDLKVEYVKFEFPIPEDPQVKRNTTYIHTYGQLSVPVTFNVDAAAVGTAVVRPAALPFAVVL